MSVTSIYVGNLPYAATEEELIDFFSQFGQVCRATLILDRETQRPRGFAFVEMANREEALKAVEEASGKPFHGRPLTVNEARNKSIRGAGNTSLSAQRAKQQAEIENKTEAPAQSESPAEPTTPPAGGYSNRLRDTSNDAE